MGLEGDADTPILHARYKGQKTRGPDQKEKKSKKKKSEAMIDKHEFGEIIGRQNPLFSLPSPLDFLLFLPPDLIGTVYWSDSHWDFSDFSDSRFCAVFPFTQSLRLPGFSSLHSTSPCIIILEFWRCFALCLVSISLLPSLLSARVHSL